MPPPEGGYPMNRRRDLDHYIHHGDFRPVRNRPCSEAPLQPRSLGNFPLQQIRPQELPLRADPTEIRTHIPGHRLVSGNMAQQTPLLIRLSPEVVERVDATRGLVPRVAWIRWAVERALEAPITIKELTELPAYQRPAREFAEDVMRGSVGVALAGPARPKPGSRLKKER